MDNPFSLKDKNILITGASSGIGRQCAVSASLMGATIVCVARNGAELEATREQLAPGNHLAMAQDMTQYDQIEVMVREAVSRVGKLHGFIHSAGIEMTLPVSMMKPAQYEKIFAINFIAGFETARVMAKKKYMDASGGSFVFISSVMGRLGQPGLVGYCSTKGALAAGAKAMALELVSKKIRVNCILPGHIDETKMTEKVFNSLPESAKQAKIDLHPLGLGKPQDVANACVYLLSDASRWVTGTNLIVDGGYSAQ